jgi:ABC-type multidrug transport system fused ATPase/permease subunit
MFVRPTPVESERPSAAMLRRVLPLVWELVGPRASWFACVLALIITSRVSSLVLPMSTKFLVDDIIVAGNGQLLAPMVAGLVAASLIQAGTQLLGAVLLGREVFRCIAALRCKIQEHVGRLPLSFYDGMQSGALSRRIMEEPSAVENLVGRHLLEVVGGVLTALFALVYLMMINPRLTLIAVAAFAGFAVLSRRLMEFSHAMHGTIVRTAGSVAGRLIQSIGGIRVVKGYHAEKHEAGVFAAGAEQLRDAWLRITRTVAVTEAVTGMALAAVTAGILYLAARDILAGTMSLGDLVTFTACLTFVMAPSTMLVSTGAHLGNALANLMRLQDLLRTQPEDESPRRVRALGRIQGVIAFENVSFAYESDHEVLSGVSFVARPGMVTALVGSSGAGKSTIINLVGAFYEPSSGTITVDGTDLSTVRLESYRTQLGVVFQESFLFDGTIMDNVRFARRDATPEQVLAACRIAHVEEFAERLPQKYDTVVGERGVKISMGQRQRISIARAVLADPRILILDEATSSLDSESEEAIQRGLAYLMQGRTTFMIAHRLSTIRRADQILVMDRGRIVERGTYEALYAARGRFHELAMRQETQHTPQVLV